MKRILLILGFIAVVFTTGYSQMNTGSLFALGVAELKMEAYRQKQINTDLDPYKILSFAFNPAAGYFLANRVAAGIMMSYAYHRIKYDVSKEITTAFLLGPFARYYYQYGAIVPFAEIFLGIGRENFKYLYEEEAGETENPHRLFKAWLGIGAAYFITDYVALELILKYFYETAKPIDVDGDGTSYSGLIFCIGFAIFFGSI